MSTYITAWILFVIAWSALVVILSDPPWERPREPRQEGRSPAHARTSPDRGTGGAPWGRSPRPQGALYGGWTWP